MGLREAATTVAISVEDCEHLVAALPDSPGLADALRLIRWRAQQIAAAHHFFKALAPVEADVLALIERHNNSKEGKAA